MSGTAECPVCDLVHLLKKRNVTAYLYSPLSFIPSRMMRGLSEAGYRPEERGLFIEVRAEEFPALIRAAGNMGGLTQMEKDAVTLCFIEEGSSFGMESLAHTKSLAQWERILGAGDLLEVLQQGRIVTRFQPIVDFCAKEMFACECLSRGEKSDGTLISPGELFGSAKKAGLLFSLDKACRMSAIHTAGELGYGGRLFINFLPTAIYNPEHCLRTTAELIAEFGMEPSRIVFEVVESEGVEDLSHLGTILDFYRSRGFLTALDDVGSGYSSLNRLVCLRPDFVKLDMGLVRDIHRDRMKQDVFEAVQLLCRKSGITMLAEGIEQEEEAAFFHGAGVRLMQGYYFAPPSESPFSPFEEQ